MDLTILIILLISGLFVGFINTLSAGGTVISIALYLALGLPATAANATNRINVLIQSFGTSYIMYRQGLLEIKKVLKYSLPTLIGAIIGSVFAVSISNNLFSYFLGGILIIMIFFLFFKPTNFHNDDEEKISRKTPLFHYLIFFLIGIYGGFIQVGTGFYLMIAGVSLIGYNILRTNALKVAIMFIYSIASILVFMTSSEIYWSYGIIHSIGAVIGSWFATRYAMKKGTKFVNYVIIAVIILTALNLFEIIDLKDFFSSLI